MFKTAVGVINRPLFPARDGQPLVLEGRRLTWLLAFLTALTALGIDMSLPAMPEFQRAFHTGVAPVQLTLSLFLMGYAVGQLVSGSLSDRIGRRPVLLVGLAAYTITGILCAISTTLTMLIVCRFLQGLGASVGPIMGRAIVRDRFDKREAASVLSQMTQVMIIVPILAPTVGGFLLAHFGWPSIFLLQGVGSALLWFISFRVLPETVKEKQPDAGRLKFVLKGIGTVISHRPTLRYSLANGFTYSGMFAYIGGAPFVFMEIYHVPEAKFGFYFAGTAAAFMIGASINRALLAARTPTDILSQGINLVLAASLVMLALSWFNIGGLAGVLLPMMTYMVGMGLVQPNATAAAMAPHGKLAGLTASLLGGIQTAGGALAGYCVGAFYNHSSLSMAATVTVFAVLTFICRDKHEGKRVISRERLAEAETAAALTIGESGL